MSYLSLGTQGATGTATGPHFHFELTKDGKKIPLSTARKDIGQYLEVMDPGTKAWTPLYAPESKGFALNPLATVTSEMGRRSAPTAGASTDHGGMDIAFSNPATKLRFRGSGNVTVSPNSGGGGNISTLQSGPYQLRTLHLSELPNATETSQSQPQLTTGSSSKTEDVLKAFIYGLTANQKEGKEEKEKEKTFEEKMKEQIIGGIISKSLSPMDFLSSFNAQDPYMSGYNTASKDYFDQFFA